MPEILMLGLFIKASRPSLDIETRVESLSKSKLPKTSTMALTNATLPYAVEIANKGWKKAMKGNPEIKLGANVMKGKVVYKAIAEAFDLEYVPIDKLL